ncbi:MAG: hypothetical protein RJB66_1845 [Pseudomonadota bacterium]|jgi:flagellar motor switch protein FliG
MKKLNRWIHLILGITFIFFVAFDSSAKPSKTSNKAAAKKSKTSRPKNTNLQKVQLVELTAQIEKLISDGYRDKINTQLDAKAFNVGAVVTLKEVVETYDAKKPGATLSAVRNIAEAVNPTDLNTGVIQLYPVLDQYKQQIDELQNRVEVMRQGDPETIGESTAKKTPKYLVSGVEIIVGIDEGFNFDQNEEFEAWLQNAVKKDFGPRGKYKISVLKKVATPIVPPKPMTRFEKLSKVQILLGSGFLGVALLFLLILYKFIPERESKKPRQVSVHIQDVSSSALNALEAKQNKATNPANKPQELEKSRPTLAATDNLEIVAQSCREIQGKIGYIYLSTPGIINPLFETWYDQGIAGRMKAAALVDAVLTSSENADQKLLVFPEKWKKDEELHQAFRAFPSVSLEERHRILDEAYWDILALNMIGQDSIKSHFEVLGHLPADRLQKLLANRESKVKALTLMHLPADKAHHYLTFLDQEERKRLVQESLQFETVPEEELKTLDESLKLQLAVEQKAEGIVNVVDLMPNILRSLTPKEELEWLPEAIEKLPDQGFKLKKSYPSLAFLVEWPEESLATFFAGVESKQTVIYLKSVPSMIDKVTKLYPTAMGTLIREEAYSRKTPSEKEQAKAFQFLKERLLNLTESGDIQLERIFKAPTEDIATTQDSETTDEGNSAA